MKQIFSCLLLAVLATGCAQQAIKKDFSAFETLSPRSILIAPVVNRSLDVDAPNYVLSTLPVPIAERGFYVFPVHTTKFVLEQEGYYEGEQIHAMPPENLAKLFGADAVLYVTIHRWDAQYIVIQTTVTVEFEYRLVSKDGTELWKDRQWLTYTPSNSGGGLLGAIIQSAIARAAPDYLPLTKRVNASVLNGPQTFPPGPYYATPKK